MKLHENRLRQFQFFLLLSVLVIAVPAIKAYTIMTGSQPLLFRESNDLSKLNGLWRSRGYGWIWSIKNGNVHGYDVTKNYCIASPFAAEDLADDIEISNKGRTMRISFEDPAYKYTFDRIDKLPENCSEARDESATSVFNVFVEIFSTHYAFFEARNIDWAGLVRDARNQLTPETTGNELFKILQSLLAPIDDNHVSLDADIGGRTHIHDSGPGRSLKELDSKSKLMDIEFNVLFDRWKRQVWSKDLRRDLFDNDDREAAGGLIRYSLVDGDIGLLSITSMEGFADNERAERHVVDKIMKRALKLFKNAKAVIIDVSMNDGGYDSVARKIAGRFAEKRTLAYSKYAGDAADDQPQQIFVEPSEKRRFTGPVYLLTSDITVSAAEIFVMCMRALPNVTHVGQTTRGALSDALWKRLPNKWAVSLSNEVYLDADGNAWEGKGIPPQVAIEVFSKRDPASSFIRAVRSIIELIHRPKA